MTICAVQEVSSGCLKITASGKPSFFIRTDYLDFLPSERLYALISFSLSTPAHQAEFNEAESEDIEKAASAFLAEKCALGYIGRAEQSRFLLSRKLESKGFSGAALKKALDFLEKTGLLSDLRYARSFLHSREAKSEGRTRLSLELNSRGVRGDVAKMALDEYFSERNEIEICRNAYIKLFSKSADSQKTYSRLSRMGFSMKTIRRALESIENENCDEEDNF